MNLHVSHGILLSLWHVELKPIYSTNQGTTYLVLATVWKKSSL
jgi:hypothetical protein